MQAADRPASVQPHLGVEREEVQARQLVHGRGRLHHDEQGVVRQAEQR